jgi:hypothetical protein
MREGCKLFALLFWNLPDGEDKCWFIHNKEHANLSVRNQLEFLKHRKTKHNDHFPTLQMENAYN